MTRAYDRLFKREAEVDQWLREAPNAVHDPQAMVGRRLEKTIIIATVAVISAIRGKGI